MAHIARKLILVRHAQASLGSRDYDRLSATGFEQAGYLADRLAVELEGAAVVRGELNRHRQTTDSLVRPGQCKVDPGLNEYRVDQLLRSARLDASRLRLDLPDPEAASGPGACLHAFVRVFPQVLEAWQTGRIECRTNGLWEAFRTRVDTAAQRLTAMLDDAESVVAVTSAGVISTMAAGLLGRDLAWQRQLNVSLYNASVTELRRDGDHRWHLVRANCVAHLPTRQWHTLA